MDRKTKEKRRLLRVQDDTNVARRERKKEKKWWATKEESYGQPFRTPLCHILPRGHCHPYIVARLGKARLASLATTGPPRAVSQFLGRAIDHYAAPTLSIIGKVVSSGHLISDRISLPRCSSVRSYSALEIRWLLFTYFFLTFDSLAFHDLSPPCSQSVSGLSD